MSKRPPKIGERKKNENTLLIDGNSLYKTGFFGAKDMYNHHGEHIGGLYQFLTVLRKLITDDLYHRVYVFWDGNFSGKLRYNIYKDYKSDRGKNFIDGTQPVDADELIQRMRVEQYLDELFIRQLKHETIESDDFIGYYCLNKKENERITICSNDRDMCQLIGEKVRVYFVDLKTYVDSTNFSSYFYYHQENSVLIKTLLGDKSDSIKGVKGLGDGTLQKFFPEIKTETITLNEIINKAKLLQADRVIKKDKPLRVLDNIINGITDGIQGDKLYEINSILVDLNNPLITEDGVEQLKDLIDGEFTRDDRGIKNVYALMKIDGLEMSIGKHRFSDYLLPFKQLLERELKQLKTPIYD